LGNSKSALHIVNTPPISDNQAMPQFGILNRSEVGLLVWDECTDGKVAESRQPGSRLKTPSLPVWVSSCAGNYGVLFNTNRELLRNYHAERRYLDALSIGEC
jgi:hypothetical protein